MPRRNHHSDTRSNYKSIDQIIDIFAKSSYPKKHELLKWKRQHIMLSKDIKKTRNLDKLTALLNKKCFPSAHSTIYPNSILINQLITKLTSFRQFITTAKLFNLAVNKNLADAHTYNSFIGSAKNQGKLQLAKDTFDKAVSLGVADSITYR